MKLSKRLVRPDPAVSGDPVDFWFFQGVQNQLGCQKQLDLIDPAVWTLLERALFFPPDVEFGIDFYELCTRLCILFGDGRSDIEFGIDVYELCTTLQNASY